jgi:hypothetical protein
MSSVWTVCTSRTSRVSSGFTRSARHRRPRSPTSHDAPPSACIGRWRTDGCLELELKNVSKDGMRALRHLAPRRTSSTSHLWVGRTVNRCSLAPSLAHRWRHSRVGVSCAHVGRLQKPSLLRFFQRDDTASPGQGHRTSSGSRRDGCFASRARPHRGVPKQRVLSGLGSLEAAMAAC